MEEVKYIIYDTGTEHYVSKKIFNVRLDHGEKYYQWDSNPYSAHRFRSIDHASRIITKYLWTEGDAEDILNWIIAPLNPDEDFSSDNSVDFLNAISAVEAVANDWSKR